GFAWLITVTAWWFSSRQKQPTKPVTMDQPSEERSIPTELESVLQKLADAYHARDEQAARDAWLQWALLNWPDNPPNNLSRLAGRCDTDLATAVNALERAIYSPNSEISWSDYEILKLIEAKDSSQSQDKADQNLLIPLNP
ncbi:MAG: hypothetical protein JAZ05_15010, partial [Candidatus Thiodiazotropha taylori]|nr:hypothetical protein [Candidatus Thiodiazotropha taylori]MCW4293327.1 hypothetical protein [Candidatus Thiodiazotropha taylori]